jgi:predicted site-specific integrase-resolvase
MKLSEYAKKLGVSYQTAWNHWKLGILDAYQLETGTVIVNEMNNHCTDVKVVIYSRVSSSQNKSNLEEQANRLLQYCNAKGYNVINIIKEIGSGLNDNRTKLNKLFEDLDFDIIVVEHKDRLTRFGFNYINNLLLKLNKKIEVVNNVDNDKEDLIQDFTSVITSFCARIYGLRRSRRRTEKLIQELSKQDDNNV